MLVLNESKVIPARLRLRKTGTGGAVEVTLLRAREGGVWEALLKPSSRLKRGGVLETPGETPRPALRLVEHLEGARWLIELESAAGGIEALGQAPLPPYISRDDSGEHAVLDRERYQTVYARVSGSVAAPTAGLHFSDSALVEIGSRGCEIARLVLHVGRGTFNPVRADRLEGHRMEAEEYEIAPAAVGRIREARANGRRIVAVGTTCVRVLETIGRHGPAGSESGDVMRGETDLFITPGFEFAITGAILTNFHMPRSTPYVLVCALAGSDLIRKAYAEAIGERYRFLSYGDAMLIL